ncbi:MAG: hypothetical protein HFI93_05605 [Lachnospiraceae bacterium]|nr:hypothetical protein [Lachnospiraceae bacterium]
MAEVRRFLAGGTKIVLRDDYVEHDPEAIRRHLENIGEIYRKYFMEEEKKRGGRKD